MQRSMGLVRVCMAVVLGGALLIQPVTSSAAGVDPAKMPPSLRARISGLLDLELNNAGESGESQDGQVGEQEGQVGNGLAGADACNVKRGGNIKVNQNCLNVSDRDLQGRGQAQNETAIAVDPNDSRRIVASYNDYRRGDGNCGTSYSLDGGRTWNDSTAPTSFTRGRGGNIQPSDFGTPRQYWQAGGDTSVAWDTRGNAYLSCQLFNRGKTVSPNIDTSSAFVVFRSTHSGGASWNFPGRYVIANKDTTDTTSILEDKQYLTVDASRSSPFRDRVYVTWTEFTDNTAAYIYEAFSADYGETFSPKHLLSPKGTQQVCPMPLTPPDGGCDNNQFSQPFTAPDGTLYVVWANYNTTQGHPIGDGDLGGGGGPGAARVGGAAPVAVGVENHLQILLSKSTDGGNTFSPPIKVGDFYELPDCPTYQAGQDAGRACVPEKGASMNSVFRAANYPVGSVNPRNPNQVIVSYASYISKTSNETVGCVPQGLSVFGQSLYDGVKTAGACNNKIVLSKSTDAGVSFTGTTQDVRALPVANTTGQQRRTDQWFHWMSFNNSGRLAISYYDRAYGDDETTGKSDISLSSTSDLARLAFDVTRVTSTSMPLPTQFPNAKGNSQFWGDYAGLATAGDSGVPIWSDTRNPDIFVCKGTATPGTPPRLCNETQPNGILANDQEIFVDVVNLSGR